MGEQEQESVELEAVEVMEEQPTTDDQSDYSSWPPAIRFDIPPHKTYHFSRHFRASSNPNNFLKGVKW